MKTLYFDIFSGASGDMILSTLIDLGVPIEHLRGELGKLHIPGLSIAVEKQKRSGIDCCHIILDWENRLAQLNGSHEHGHHHHGDHDSFRNPRQILEIIKNAGYPVAVLSRCEKIIRRLSEAEAAVHGVSVDEVHFHEIGAVDTIIDVAGISLCLDYLGVERITFSTLVDGRGTVHTRHGVMPVPVPAVAKLCEGFTLTIVDINSELLTPTGCAVLTALGEQLSSGFTGCIEKTGYGCGDKVFEKSPNALRTFLLKAADTTTAPDDHAWCLESDMDHISGEIMGDAAERLMQAGALDVSWSPVFMKKGRPGYRLTVICDNEKKQALVDLIILHTRTLGVRIQRMERVIAHREVANVQFLNEEIQEKHCTYKNVSFSKPEYESLSMLAEKTGRPVIELMEDYAKNRIEKS
jgi:uncharacterized protein (TIGR00299 family) protein